MLAIAIAVPLIRVRRTFSRLTMFCTLHGYSATLAAKLLNKLDLT